MSSTFHTAPEPPFARATAAATLVVMRPASREQSGADNASADDASADEILPDEILMVRRAKSMAFAAGAAVFPGGRVDTDDYTVAAMHGHSPSDVEAASRVAALRETLEETGLAIGWKFLAPSVTEKQANSADLPAPLATRTPAFDHSAARRDLLGGRLLSDILREQQARLALDSLYYFARWCPQHPQARNFDTRFFAVEAPDYDHELTIEQGENSAIFWSSAAHTLAMADSGDVKIIFPTRRNLERIRESATYAKLVAAPLQRPVPCIVPWVETKDNKTYLAIPEGLGYPTTRERLNTPS